MQAVTGTVVKGKVVLEGDAPLKMEIVSVPVNEEGAAECRQNIARIADALESSSEKSQAPKSDAQ